MAENTIILDLEVINRSTEAKTTLVGTWIDGMSNNMRKIDKGFGEMKHVLETKTRIILDTTEPDNMDNDTYWLQDIGDSLDFAIIEAESIAFVNVNTSNTVPDNDSVFFEDIII